MSNVSTKPTIDADEDGPPTALQLAIRKRALDAIAEQQSRPSVSLSQRLLTVGFTLAAVLIFLLLVNFFVTGMFKILDNWYPGSISGKVTQPVPARPINPDLTQPFYISVDPPLETASPDERATSSSAAAKDTRH